MLLKSCNKIPYSILGIITILSTLFYGTVKTFSFLRYKSPIGDENSFMTVFQSIKNIGFFETWQSGNFSPTFFLLTYPLDLLIDNALLASRIVSILALVFSLIALYRFGKYYLNLKGVYLYSSIVFITSFFFYRIYWQGINDTLFHLIVILSLFCCYNIHFKKKTLLNLIILGVLLGLLIGTRFIAFLVIPGYIFFLYKNLKHIVITGLFTVLTALLLHLPSLIHNNTLASINKDPKNGMTWAQRNYLTQVYIYDGKLPEGTRVTWSQLQNYIDKNGKEGLPNTFTESIVFNPKWTILELFNDFWYSIKKGYWKFFGLGLLIIIWFTFYGFKKVKTFSESFKFTHKFLLFFWLHTFFISLVVIFQIEFRWYSAFIYLGILFFHQIIQDYKPLFNKAKRLLFIKANTVLLIIFQMQYIFLDYNPFNAFIRKTLRVYLNS